MRVWGIADLHLNLASADSPGRDRYAGRWREHVARVEAGWRSVVARDDLVLIPGDVSEARNHREVQPDLAWLARLPGTKVLSAGNHDRWFNAAVKVRPLLRRGMHCVGGDAEAVAGAIVCGTLGAPPPADDREDAGRLAALDRELASLDRALEEALAIRTADEPIFVLWHYPPFDAHRRPGPAVARLEAAGVKACVYGHLHRQGQWSAAVQGVVGGVRYHCVAADAVGFRPLQIDGGQD